MDVTLDMAVMDVSALRDALHTVRSVLAPDLNDQELQLFAMVAHRSRLDPFARQIHAIKRQGRLTFQTGIDGLRSSAEETGEYRGSDEPEFGPIIDKPYPHPEWARVVVHRVFPSGERLDQPATVWWDEYYPGDAQGFQWKKMPRVMLAKVAEAAAFRKAFPRRFASVYESAEMDQAYANEAPVPVVATPKERINARLAQIEPADPPKRVETAIVEPVAETAVTMPVLEDVEAQRPAIEAVPVAPAVTGGEIVREQCPSLDPYEGTQRCRKAAGHAGTHRTSDVAWS